MDEERQIMLDQIRKSLKELLPPALSGRLDARDAAGVLSISLPETFSTEEVARAGDAQMAWELCGSFFRLQNRYHEALRIYRLLYYHMIAYQQEKRIRVHKGTPLVWIYDCHANLGRPVIARRFIMLTCIEDAIELKGKVDPESTGSYFRAVWSTGLPHSLIERYAREAYENFKDNEEYGAFPEWVLQQLDQDWILGYPTHTEVGIYPCNELYQKFLLDRLGSGSGRELELLAEYLLSVMPGCRTYRRKRSGSTEYDIVCAVEGVETDFRSELGRFFLCECKDWKAPADFTAFAKFCRVLDSVKARFGILFSRNGISGAGRARDASLEQIKVFQDRGIVIVVVDLEDLQAVSVLHSATDFMSMLRRKYEAVRLNLAG